MRSSLSLASRADAVDVVRFVLVVAAACAAAGAAWPRARTHAAIPAPICNLLRAMVAPTTLAPTRAEQQPRHAGTCRKGHAGSEGSARVVITTASRSLAGDFSASSLDASSANYCNIHAKRRTCAPRYECLGEHGNHVDISCLSLVLKGTAVGALCSALGRSTCAHVDVWGGVEGGVGVCCRMT